MKLSSYTKDNIAQERSTYQAFSCNTEEDLLRIYELAQERGLPCALVTDVGKTEFDGVPTHTCVAIGPALVEDIDPITGKSGLVKTRLI